MKVRITKIYTNLKIASSILYAIFYETKLGSSDWDRTSDLRLMSPTL